MRLRALLITLGLALFALPLWATDADGNWIITIKAAGVVVHGFGALTVNGDAVRGWVGPSPDQPIDVDGTLKGKKLILHTHPSPGRTVAFGGDWFNRNKSDPGERCAVGTMHGCTLILVCRLSLLQ